MIAFLSHEYTSNPNENIQNAAIIAKIIYHKYPGITLFSPLHAFSFLDETEDYDRLMDMCYTFLSLSNFLIRTSKSKGCDLEMEFAEKNNIPILYWDNEKEEIVGKFMS